VTTSALRPSARGRAAAWTLWALAGAAVVAGLAALGAAGADGPDDTICRLKSATGVACPTCGLTRSLACLARGDLAGSVRAHPLGIPVVLQLAGVWGFLGVALARRRVPGTERWIPAIVALDAAAFLAVWLARWAGGRLP